MQFTVLIPVYDTPPQFLVESILSCLRQTLPPAEILIVDDGSTSSATRECLDQLRRAPTVRLLSWSGNRGIAEALNSGLENASFEWIARMDADDVMLPHRLGAQADYLLRSDQPDVVGGQLMYFGAETGQFTTHPEVITPQLAMDHPDGWFVNHPTAILRRRTVVSAGGYDARFTGCEDMELWYRLLSRGSEIRNLQSIVLLYRIHPGQATGRSRVVPLAQFKGYLASSTPPTIRHR